jgi:hypothetical protein
MHLCLPTGGLVYICISVPCTLDPPPVGGLAVLIYKTDKHIKPLNHLFWLDGAGVFFSFRNRVVRRRLFIISLKDEVPDHCGENVLDPDKFF